MSAMGLLTFALNVTLDGCCDHREAIADDELHDYFTQLMDAAGAMLWGASPTRPRLPVEQHLSPPGGFA
jgi:hypothetical protein